jgi:AcrR family transcriptional regulator
MRPDARRNYSHLLAIARDVVTEHGADASMRDIARRANVGLATLFRHFPTREALFESLLRSNLDALTQKAGELETSNAPDQALVSWFREGVAFVHSYSGVVALMASAHEDPDSALYAPCTAVHEAGARLLLRAQAEGTERADILLSLGSLIDHFRPFSARDRPHAGSRHFRRAFLLSEAIAQNPAKKAHFSLRLSWPPQGRAANQRQRNVRGI